jgi:V/A-type H+-transporting ATPase subunit I
MIAPMMKYHFLLYRGDFNDFLAQLQELGMIHVESRNVEVNEETGAIIRKVDSFNKISAELENVTRIAGAVPFEGDADTLVEKYIETKEQLAKLETSINKIRKDIEDAAPWGDFREEDPERIRLLGLNPKFYIVPVRQFDEKWAEKYPLCEISRDKTKVYFVILSDNRDFDFELQEIKPPLQPRGRLQDELNRLNDKHADCERQLSSLALSSGILAEECRLLTERIDFNIAQLSARNEAGDSLKILTGWLPKEHRAKFDASPAIRAAVYFTEEEIPADEEPPILLKNNGFSRLFEPITNLYSLPNYRELDSTPFFAPFFMLFFGFCLGDGGYGLLILLAASLLKIKITNTYTRSILSLAQYLGAATLLFGFITATFFGISIDQIKIDKVVEQHFGLKENFGMMILALLLGFVQIIFAMFVNAAKTVRQKGWKHALSTWAWIVIILGGATLYLLDGSNSDNAALVNTTGVILCMAGFIALFYNTPDRNPLVNLGSGLWTAYNMISGLLGDVLSYIRLFVLGLTGGIIGGVFNTLATAAGGGVDIPVISQFVTLIILLLGHGLNLALSILGAVVHPMRLTFVEFYKNAGFDGGGYPFKPFGKIK